MSAPEDIARRRHHRQPRPTSHWSPDRSDTTPHAGDVASCEVCNPKAAS